MQYIASYQNSKIIIIVIVNPSDMIEELLELIRQFNTVFGYKKNLNIPKSSVFLQIRNQQKMKFIQIA